MLKERITDDFDVSIAEFQSGRFDYKIVLTKETRKSSPIARRIPPPLKVSRLWVGSEISFTSKSALQMFLPWPRGHEKAHLCGHWLASRRTHQIKSEQGFETKSWPDFAEVLALLDEKVPAGLGLS